MTKARSKSNVTLVRQRKKCGEWQCTVVDGCRSADWDGQQLTTFDLRRRRRHRPGSVQLQTNQPRQQRTSVSLSNLVPSPTSREPASGQPVTCRCTPHLYTVQGIVCNKLRTTMRWHSHKAKTVLHLVGDIYTVSQKKTSKIVFVITS